MKDISHYLSLLGEFANKYAERYGISRIGIFGSVARGEQKNDSDIDIYYEGKPHGLMSSFDLHGELEKLFGRRVDLVRRHSNINKYLLARINREVVYV
ncbi:MAG: nucleotidyltransferase family protein [Fibromonadales bacterium]|nr:nucleotidyltransferase family protein [Fibromonadales bacterium]